MPGVVTNKKNLYLGKCLDDLHKLSEIKQLPNTVNIIVRSADKVFRDAEKLDNEGDEERALVMYMKYFNILKQVKSKADYKKQKEYFDNLIGRKNQYQAIERAEKLTESLKDRYDFQKAELLARKLPSVDSVPAKKEHSKEKEVPKDSVDTIVKAEPNILPEKECKKHGSITCMQLCDLLRDSGTKLILMDLRTSSDFAKSHISHSECISVPSDILVPGSTVTHVEGKLTDESKVTWKTRKNADHIILIDWKSKMEDVKIGTPIQTLKDALYKFDTTVIIKSEPLLLEGGYENWLVFYPTMTTNPHVAVPDQAGGQNDRAPSPSLLLDFDYPELDENLQKKVKAPATIQNNVTPVDNGVVSMNAAVPKVDRSLKPSLNNQPSSSNVNPELKSSSEVISSSQTSQPSVNNNVYPSIYRGLNAPNQTNVNKVDNTIMNSKAGQKPINLSVKNNLSTDGQKADVNHQNSVTKNENMQDGKDKTEEVERKLRELDLLKKKKEKDVADLMRMGRKMKEELETEQSKREENQRILAVEEEKRKAALQQSEKEEEERKKRVMDVEKLRMERKEKLRAKQKEEEELQKVKAEQEAHAMREVERKEKELQQVEERKRLEQEEEEQIAREMQELEKAKAERLKKEELRIMEEKRLEAERQKERLEADQKEEEEKKRKELMKLEEEKKAKEVAERKKLLEMKTKENSGDQRSEKTVPTTNLPAGWEKRLDKYTNRYYYIDHNKGITTWQAPTGGKIPIGVARDTYTTKLKDEQPTLSRSLSRSHSSPNIMKELADEEAALAKKPMVTVDRASKPSSNNKMIQPMFSMRKRDLNPTYGNVIQGLTGLRNLGNTCYMNSTIQCLNNTSPLITYFLSDNYHRDVNRESSQGMHGEVVDDFSVVIKALWSGQYRSITPRDLKSTVGKYNPMFSGYQQQDSQEFLTFLLDGLHEGLNEVKKAPEIPEQNNDNLSDDKAARLAWEHHKLLHRSIIVELFQGQLKSTLMCRTCSKTSVTFQAFMFLSLPIPASSKCSLKDCMKEFLKPEMMTGSCKWKCPRCKIERDSEKKIDIWKLPPILLVGLNRFYSEGMWMQKKTTYVDFPITDVDFSPYILGPPPRNRYNLYGISNHYGTMEGGHYTAFCRNPVTTKWYKFDDQDVSDISKSDIKTSAAFVLYYTSIEMPAPQYKIGF